VTVVADPASEKTPNVTMAAITPGLIRGSAIPGPGQPERTPIHQGCSD
jgi:hypothetical protein